MSEHVGLSFVTLGPEVAGVPDGARSAQVHGFGEAVLRAFLEGRRGEEWHDRWTEHLRSDRVTLRGAWADDEPLDAGSIPVATFSSFDKQINVGGGRMLPVRMITDVSVSPAYRRRGLTRHLMRTDLDDAVARGVPLAALTVSEAGIYARFGFGPATRQREVVVDTSRFALRDDVAAHLGEDPGRMVLAEPGPAWPAVSTVFDRWHARTRGSLERPQFYEPELSGRYDLDAEGPAKKLRAIVHLDARGEPDGHLLYTPVGEVDGRQTLRVDDLLALSQATYLRLWRFVAQIDLVRQVRWRRAQLVDPLDAALVDLRAVQTRAVSDVVWVRVLDVVSALEARPWYADGAVVLDVTDPLGHATGRWRVVVRDGVASVAPTDEPVAAASEASLGADTLAELYLGGTPVQVLAGAGRVVGSEEVVGRLGSMLDGGPAPYSMTGF